MKSHIFQLSLSVCGCFQWTVLTTRFSGEQKEGWAEKKPLKKSDWISTDLETWKPLIFKKTALSETAKARLIFSPLCIHLSEYMHSLEQVLWKLKQVHKIYSAYEDKAVNMKSRVFLCHQKTFYCIILLLLRMVSWAEVLHSKNKNDREFDLVFWNETLFVLLFCYFFFIYLLSCWKMKLYSATS